MLIGKTLSRSLVSIIDAPMGPPPRIKTAKDLMDQETAAAELFLLPPEKVCFQA